jgi:Zn-finger nucleic acid-binding protein
MILISCPDCARQYDVTHLEPGSSVRCACEVVFSVKARRLLVAKALKCTNCGGALGTEEEACSYCGAGITAEDRRRTTLCPQCFARLEDDSRHCKGCGVAISPQALTPIPEGTACPSCEGTLLHRAVGDTDVIECADCRGLWIGARAFEEVCRSARGRAQNLFVSDSEKAAGGIAPPAKSRSRAYIPCIECRDLMLQKHFRVATRSSGVIVDYCKSHGVWLDDEELERIVTFIESSDAPPATGGSFLSGDARTMGKAAARRRRMKGGAGGSGLLGSSGLGGFGLWDVVGVLGDGLLGDLFD